MTPPAWRDFERVAYEIQRDLAGDARVTLRDTIRGAECRRPRQIDISVRQRIGPHEILIVVDCKAHEELVDINVVEQFVTMVRDVRANKGALIAGSGFTAGAVDMARAHGMDTFTLVDTASPDWRAYVSIPALLHRAYLAAAAFRFTGVAHGGTRLPSLDPGLWELSAPDGTRLGTARDLLARKWNAQEVPMDRGRHEVDLAVDAGIVGCADSLRATVVAVVEVSHAYYFGHLPIQTRGLHDAQTGGLITREIATDMLEPAAIEQGRVAGWRRIDDPAALAVRPVLRLEYSDVLPVSTELGGAQ